MLPELPAKMEGESTGAVGIEEGFGTKTIKAVVDADFLHNLRRVKMVGSVPFLNGSACANV